MTSSDFERFSIRWLATGYTTIVQSMLWSSSYLVDMESAGTTKLSIITVLDEGIIPIIPVFILHLQLGLHELFSRNYVQEARTQTTVHSTFFSNVVKDS